MKKFLCFVISIMFIFSNTLTIQAANNKGGGNNLNKYEDSILKDAKTSRKIAKPDKRGSFFSQAEIGISDVGGGKIEVFVQALMHHPVDEVFVTIYLDRWIDSRNDWAQVNYYEYEFSASDYPNGLTAPSIAFFITGQPRGYYYRLRGSFGAVYNGEMEFMSASTDGITID